MNASPNCFAIIKKYEGYKDKAYLCPAKKWTIGYGHTAGVKSGDTCTEAKAMEYLRADVKGAESAVRGYDKDYHWTQNEFDALVSFTFNVGAGNLKNLITGDNGNEKRTKQVISSKMPLYRKAGGVVLKGLEKRRAEEKALFDKH